MTGLLLDAPRDTAPSFAEPGEALGAADTMKALFRAPIDPIVNPQPYADLIRASERSTRFTGNIASESAAREEAYDIRNKAIKSATGIDLENPERDGYQREARAEIRRQMREGAREGVDPNIQGGIYALQRRMYDAAAAAATERFPDVQFGPIDDDAKKVAQESIQRFQEARKAPGLNPFVAPLDVFGGSLIGSRRDPIFLGSLLAGPASSTSRYALGRIASGAVRMGFYNAGISALEQPAVQEWRAKLGLEHGITPALEDVGQAFLFGAIPGAVIHGGVEAVRAVRMRRVLAGQPEPGDVADALLALKTVSERDAAALRAGEDSALADKATMTIPRPKDVPPELHDDMAAAALKRADQPDAPSPEAVAAVKTIEAYHGSPHDFDAFSIDKIGTGEGAQVYGHGLYFAENKDVAKIYSRMPPVTASGAEVLANQTLRGFKGDASAAAKSLRTSAVDDGNVERAQIKNQAAALIEGGASLPKANLYQARIHAAPEHFLDWDKPLSEQAPQIQEAVKRAMGIDYDGKFDAAKAERLWKEFQHADAGVAIRQGFIASDDALVAQRLRAAGIPGIKYLDQGSRAAGEGSRNFVVFSDKDVEITHKNGAPVRKADAPPEVQERMMAAAPKTAAEAAQVADEALDDLGRQHGAANLRESMARGDAERAVSMQLSEPAEGMARLFRVDRLKGSNPNLPSWMTQTDYYRQLLKAEGRWFAADDENIQWYLKAAKQEGFPPVVKYVDVPKSELEQYRVSNLPEGHEAKEFSRRPKEEFFVPGEVASARKELPENFSIPGAKRPRGDVLDKVPFIDDTGSPKMLTSRATAALGERENTLSMLVKSCK